VHGQVALEHRHQDLGEGELERPPGLGLRTFDHQPPAFARAHQMPPDLEGGKVPPPQGPGGKQRDDQPVAVGHRRPLPRQRLRPGLGLRHQPATEGEEVVARLQALALAVAPGTARLDPQTEQEALEAAPLCTRVGGVEEQVEHGEAVEYGVGRVAASAQGRDVADQPRGRDPLRQPLVRGKLPPVRASQAR
jgi:hypothetical protein